jgi:hypothetical protein
MGGYEESRQDLLLVEKAETFAVSSGITEDDRYLVGGLRSHNIGDWLTRDNLGRELSSRIASASANVYYLPDAVRERVLARLTANSHATQASE